MLRRVALVMYAVFASCLLVLGCTRSVRVVSDVTGEPIPDVRVTPSAGLTATTNSKGRARLPIGRGDFAVKRPGYYQVWPHDKPARDGSTHILYMRSDSDALRQEKPAGTQPQRGA